ncbi:MAG: polysaccharide transporter [Bacilli bacterium]|nr:polysaccharide transporter [Bacilli bacterium]
MRTKNSINNTIASLFTNIITIFIGIIAQAFFLKILGTEYLGINSLFTNIVSMLGIIELGLGSAIIYNLYRPIQKKEKNKINALMNFYKKAYTKIAFIFLGLGFMMIPILPFFIKNVSIGLNLNIIFILFIIDIFCSYLLSYKRSILYADQKRYIINIIHILYLILLNILQILFLIITKNYYCFLLLKIIFRIIENINISSYVNKKYPYLKGKNKELLDKETEKDIYQKIKALFFHKIGGFVITSTDNIIISKFLGIIQVGLYSNYFLIFNSVQILFSNIIYSTTASIGNLLVDSTKEKNYEIFRRIKLINIWLTTFSSAAILLLITPFIQLWLGNKYLLPEFVLIVLVINHFQLSMRSSYLTFKEAAGIFHQDRFIPIIESIINIILSIILVKFFSLAGVFIGTIISSFVLYGYSYPKLVYKNLFAKNYMNYFLELIKSIFIFIIACTCSCLLADFFYIDNLYLELIINSLISITIPTLIIIIFFRKTDEYKYFKDMLKKIFRKKVISNEE